MSKVIHLGNGKGGVKKTTTSVALALRLAERGKKVLLIDTDGQCDLSRLFGVNSDSVGFSTAELYKPDFHFEPVKSENFDWKDKGKNDGEIYVVPANLAKLADVRKLPFDTVLNFRNNVLNIAEKMRFDFVIIDTPPSLDINQMAGLATANYTIMPLSCDFESCGEEKIKQYFNVVKSVKNQVNKSLAVPLVVLTDVDAKGDLTKKYLAWTDSFFGTAKLDEYVEHSAMLPNALAAKRAPWYKPGNGNDRVKGQKYKKVIDAILARFGEEL
jgi:chromosome partitioning protein